MSQADLARLLALLAQFTDPVLVWGLVMLPLLHSTSVVVVFVDVVQHSLELSRVEAHFHVL